MQIERKSGFAPRTESLSEQVVALHGPCVGCSECKGLCTELIEAIVIPDLVLNRG